MFMPVSYTHLDVYKRQVRRKSAWFLKATMLPWIYWNGMLKGREWLARPLGN